MALLIVRAVHVCRLYRERLSQVNSKLAEVEAGRAAEYLEPLAVLLENMQVRTKVAGNWNRQRPAGAGDPPHTHTHWPFPITITVCIPVFVRYLQRVVSGVSQAQVRLRDPGSMSTLGGQRHPHLFSPHHCLVCTAVGRLFSSQNSSVCSCRVRSCYSSTQYKTNWRRK